MTCRGRVSSTATSRGTDPYVSIPAYDVADYRDALAAMTAMDDEINTSADYWNWDGVDPLTYGCLFGGSIEYTAYRNGYKAALDDCALTDRLPLTGDATIDTTRGTFALRVTGPSATSLAWARRQGRRRHGTWFGSRPRSPARSRSAAARLTGRQATGSSRPAALAAAAFSAQASRTRSLCGRIGQCSSRLSNSSQ